MRMGTAFGVVVIVTLVGGCMDPTAERIARDYDSTSRRIIMATLDGNDGWLKMQELCDGIGNRISGSASLEKAVAWAAEAMKRDGQENVHTEPVMVPKWVRGVESLTMKQPRECPIAMLGLGGSVGATGEGITAPVAVVGDEKELDALGEGARGKIVLFNNRMQTYDPAHGSGYGTTVRFRHKGAQLAAEKGAAACLVRSVTARSLRSPHTGAMEYGEAKVRIPAAAISTEDADMIGRLVARKQEVVLTLKMDARMEGEAPSANVIGEIRGSERPDEVVVMGGHIDSWDVGQGAMDDGAGSVMCMEALHVLRRLNLRPRRTIRVVLWTNEENGLAGGKQYAKDHAAELARHVAAIESDSGAFMPEGFGVECKDAAMQKVAAAQLAGIARLLRPIGAAKVEVGHSGADVGAMKDLGVLLMGLSVEGSTYFDYHHTQADTLDKIDPKALSKCVAALAVESYVIADMPVRLGEANK